MPTKPSDYYGHLWEYQIDKLRTLAKKERNVLTHYTIELRVSMPEDGEEVEEAISKVVGATANYLHKETLLRLPHGHYASVACFSDDFFKGYSVITEYTHAPIGGYEG